MYVCFTESEHSEGWLFLCQTNKGNGYLTVRTKYGESFRQCASIPGMPLLVLSFIRCSFATHAVIINVVLFILLPYYTKRAFCH